MRNPPYHTSRPMPSVHGPSGELAHELREQPPAPDEITRARMERRLIEAWRTHAAARVPLPQAQPRLRKVSTGMRVPRSTWAASLAASAFAGGMLALFVFASPHKTSVPVGTGRFELRIGDAAMQSGAVAEGQVLESGQHGRINVDLGTADVQMAVGTRLRFDRMAEHELRFSVLKGRVDVDFHPAHKGDQRMIVQSLAARVTVVGTRFSVAVDVLGNTDVAVTEGVVEVAPRSGATARRLSAGEQFAVRADDGDDSERAVRDAIEQQLGDVEPSAVAVANDEALPEVMEFELDDTDLVSSADTQVYKRQLRVARRLLRQGRHTNAREKLRALAEGSAPIPLRVEALTLMAESYTAKGDLPRAAGAYERADQIAPRHPAGHNARFALARLLERYAHDDDAATRAYMRYLERAPDGALAHQAMQALCRLGEAKHCR